jgi:hypothetical protein
MQYLVINSIDGLRLGDGVSGWGWGRGEGGGEGKKYITTNKEPVFEMAYFLELST